MEKCQDVHSGTKQIKNVLNIFLHLQQVWGVAYEQLLTMISEKQIFFYKECESAC